MILLNFASGVLWSASGSENDILLDCSYVSRRFVRREPRFSDDQERELGAIIAFTYSDAA